MKIFKKMLTLTLMIALVASITGCGNLQLSSSNQSALQKAKDEGVVTIGFANEKPYAYKENGKVTGEAVEVAKAVFKKLGIKKVKPVLTDFGSLIPGLKAGRFDVITAGMYITPERCKEVAFANPEYSIGESLAVKKGNPKNLHSYEDVAKNPQVKIGVMKGAIEESYMKDAGVKESQIIIVPDQPSAVAALEAGRVDGITMTGPSLRAVLDSAKAEGVEEVKDFKQPKVDGKEVRGYGAAAFRVEDKDFQKAFTKELEKMKDSGELYKTLKPFGFTKEDLPGDYTAEELCKKQ
ncbi:ectoine/hydroxyectoine ABC transporter substrate-binding protein EhuB [Marinithermofilum abyssi]|uniref:Ectoine/hydroxyectoine ABC transporter substrate-binding protein EhuB n=1 Tax=Marinithermofilum abyssi TaxID=1571185 RepID=A0A8J2YCA7_9BACL|nr:ectoine/hydroxyectoine ABC transporter substrate-binding protein EhuB [Marinithermofilum abyssi]GGE13690.1 ectoine/hydroxyectoine ABC transporter substrate-binding protein EhuB [Marinithermofilum abyssi]